MICVDGQKLVLKIASEDSVTLMRYEKDYVPIQTPCFGIPAMPETDTSKNSIFVYRLFEMLLADAADKNMEIPGIIPGKLLKMIENMSGILDEVTVPCYIHTDTWDGNIMVENRKFC